MKKLNVTPIGDGTERSFRAVGTTEAGRRLRLGARPSFLFEADRIDQIAALAPARIFAQKVASTELGHGKGEVNPLAQECEGLRAQLGRAQREITDLKRLS